VEARVGFVLIPKRTGDGLPATEPNIAPKRTSRRSLNLRISVLFVVIPMAWLAFAFLGLAMCRLGALSDRSHAAALAKWVADCHVAGREISSAAAPGEQLPFGTHRATG
jgi:hypothetical protein